ncbi:FISUMP domain-containing protein [Psychroflexus salis]|uniref:Fibrobacter succinogenes major paralogous domain-containing protein n=1 Tax=Psychroflexus salis TaxID=1526574 RepID=A0A916ZVA2_9FLAO|nr:FISUMP domain-containing protein [Psychroflexus salis]GGE15720.1 hypothetical protein GCM10010831_16290 [Psychroflexus salis]
MDTIIVNNLFWQTKNLAQKTFKDGLEIDFAINKMKLEKYNNLKIPCYHWYNFDSNNSHLGYCYNEFAIKNINEIVEDDFRLPTLDEWKDLVRICGYLFEDDETHLWDSTWDYNQNRQKNNIKSLKDLKKRGKWKGGNHSGNGKLGFQAVPHDYGTFTSWAYLEKDNLTVGTFCVGNTPNYKKIEAWANSNFISGFVRLVKNKNESINENYIEIKRKIWASEDFNHLSFKIAQIPKIENPKKWGEETRLQKPAYCYYKNDSENGYMLYNYFACKTISKQLPKEYRIASLSDFNNLIKHATNQDRQGLLSLLDVSYWKQFYFLDYRNVKSTGLNIKPNGIRRASFVTFWEGESLYTYKYFSGKGSYAMFWTSDGYIVEFELELGKIKFKTHKVDDYYNGLGLSIRLIKE